MKSIIMNSILKQTQWQLVRNMSVIAKSLKFEKFGDPINVLKIVEDKLEDPKGKQVLVKVLAAPINPSDVLTIRRMYPAKPKFPAIPGFECVAEVIEVGEDVKNLSPGQRVVPAEMYMGTWTTHAIFNENQLMPISSKISIVDAATIKVNPCTAYRMLKDFVNLKPGDSVIQNGANSAVGQAVHQLCRAWGIQSVGIVRDRPNIAELKAQLKELGATEVLTEEELKTTRIFKDKIVSQPKLALNCVGGKSAAEISRQLANKGAMVTYGAMTDDPIIALPAALIFKNISHHGFWITTWFDENFNLSERKQMFDELCELMESKKFLEPIHETVPLENFKDGARDALSLKGFNGKKVLFVNTH